MSLTVFINDLLETGRVQVPAIEPLDSRDIESAANVLQSFDQQFRQQLPGTPPAFSEAAALWGATVFYRACQFLVYRDHEAAEIDAALSAPCPDAAGAAAHYSVDLTLRLLPDLVRLTQARSSDDPLVEHLQRLASAWPLSSVGVADVGQVDVEPLAQEPSLLGLYVDRIIAREDTARLGDPRVRNAVRAALGIFPELAPNIAAAIEAAETEETVT
jgi:hypothetical protein